VKPHLEPGHWVPWLSRTGYLALKTIDLDGFGLTAENTIWRSRHSILRTLAAELPGTTKDPRLQCRCSSALAHPFQCVQPMTAEDLRCDECRLWCRFDNGELFPLMPPAK
jgi:hypothetical protein